MKTLNILIPGAALTAALAFVACGGGGSSSPAPAVPGAPNAPAQNSARASVSIVVPARPAAGDTRSTQYISSSTQSMTFATVDGTGKATQIAEFDLTPTSPGCAAVTGGGTQCTETFNAPAGTSTFAVTAYDATGGKGNVLSNATLQAQLTAGTNNTIPLVLNGNATKATVVLGTSLLPVGNAGSTSVGIMATDAQNNVIVGPGAFATPIALAITGDTNSTLSLSASTIAKPGQVVTLSYNGNSLTGAQIAPSASGLAGTSATFAGSGYAVSNFTLGTGGNYVIPWDVKPIAGGGAAFVWYSYNCCSLRGIGVIDNGGNSTLLIGDTYDPLATPSPSPTPTSSSSPTPNPFDPSTVVNVHGMMNDIYDDGEADAGIATGSFGTVYFASQFSHDPVTPGGTYDCNFGVIDAINPVTHALVSQTIIKGAPYGIHSDSNGAIWFVEWSGQTSLETSDGSGGVNYAPYVPALSGNGTTSEYALGKLNADGTVAFEIPFSKLGFNIADNEYPADFTVAPDGSAVYILEYYNQRVVKVALSGGTPTLGSAQNAQIPSGSSPYAIAAGTDGTVVFSEDNEPNNNYYFGFIPAGATFGSAAVVEFPFSPTEGTYSYSVVAADGNFWFADDNAAGIGRFWNFGKTGPLEAYIATQPASQSDYENCGMGVGYGAAWVAQCSDGSIVRVLYGAPGTATQANASVRMLSVARAASGSARRYSTHKHGVPHGKTTHRLPKSPATDRMSPAQKIQAQAQGLLRSSAR